MNLLWKPLSFGEYQAETTLLQANVKVYCDLTKLIQRHIFFYGGYEQQYCDHWIRFARRSKVVFDIGANVGLYSLLAAKTNPKASIHAFEPTPTIVDIFKQNIQINDIRNIRVNEVAIGSQSGNAILRDCRGDKGINEGMNFIECKDSECLDTDIPVNIISVDDYCSKNKINNIDIMKIDIEGGEYNALAGAKIMLSTQSIGCIMIEFIEWAMQRSGYSNEDLREILLEANYKLYVLRSGGFFKVCSNEVLDGLNVFAFAKNFNFK